MTIDEHILPYLLHPEHLNSLGWCKCDLGSPFNAHKIFSIFFQAKTESVELTRDGHLMIPILFEGEIGTDFNMNRFHNKNRDLDSYKFETVLYCNTYQRISSTTMSTTDESWVDMTEENKEAPLSRDTVHEEVNTLRTFVDTDYRNIIHSREFVEPTAKIILPEKKVMKTPSEELIFISNILNDFFTEQDFPIIRTKIITRLSQIILDDEFSILTKLNMLEKLMRTLKNEKLTGPQKKAVVKKVFVISIGRWVTDADQSRFLVEWINTDGDILIDFFVTLAPHAFSTSTLNKIWRSITRCIKM